MITAYDIPKTAERFQSDHTGRRLTRAVAQSPNSAASFDGGLFF